MVESAAGLGASSEAVGQTKPLKSLRKASAHWKMRRWTPRSPGESWRKCALSGCQRPPVTSLTIRQTSPITYSVDWGPPTRQLGSDDGRAIQLLGAYREHFGEEASDIGLPHRSRRVPYAGASAAARPRPRSPQMSIFDAARSRAAFPFQSSNRPLHSDEAAAIAVVDPDEQARAAASRLCESQGYRVLPFASGDAFCAPGRRIT